MKHVRNPNTDIFVKLAEKGNVLSEFAKENVFTIKRPLDGSDASTETALTDETKTITQYKIEQGSLIALKGDVVFDKYDLSYVLQGVILTFLDSDKPKGCLTRWFVKDSNVLADYFTCVECKLNCKSFLKTTNNSVDCAHRVQ